MGVGSLASDAGRRVFRVDRAEGSVVVKCPRSCDQVDVVRGEAAHALYMRELPATTIRYPASRINEHGCLVRRYVHAPTLAEALATTPSPGALLAVLASAMVRSHFAWGADVHASASGHLSAFFDLRRRRALAGARRIGDGEIARLVAGIEAPSRQAQLVLSLHGDLTFENVLVSDNEFHFIDTRAVWVAGIPRWDLACDLAMLLLCVRTNAALLGDGGWREVGAGVIEAFSAVEKPETLVPRIRDFMVARSLGIYGDHIDSERLERRQLALNVRELFVSGSLAEWP